MITMYAICQTCRDPYPGEHLRTIPVKWDRQARICEACLNELADYLQALALI